jgi:Mrp family chromosome partitioning ATPase
MASAEILRIIDVGSSKDEASGEPSSSRDGWQRNGPPRRRPNATAKLALWPGPNPTQEIVAFAEPVPLIHVDNVAATDRVDPRVVLLADPTSDAARSYRLLRHRLFGLGDPRVIAVTSARAGEGKTTCAVNLALALAEDATSQVLFLEANLGHPVAARLFGFELFDSVLGAALRTRIAGPPYPVTAIVGTRMHLSALASEPVPGARLDRHIFASLLSDLREVYDYIVIDAGPVLESGDADVAGECASGVIVTARSGKSRKPDFRRAVDQLRPTPVFGTVLFDA